MEYNFSNKNLLRTGCLMYCLMYCSIECRFREMLKKNRMHDYSHSLAIVGSELRFSHHFEPNVSTVASSSVFHKINRHDSPGLVAESISATKQECACMHINYFAAALVHVTQFLNGWGKQMLLSFFFFFFNWEMKGFYSLHISYIFILFYWFCCRCCYNAEKERCVWAVDI